ncbi:MAG: carbonic anhydrase family protein [bacterium]|nr:carbonic anhydrase family protein [bacterium]
MKLTHHARFLMTLLLATLLLVSASAIFAHDEDKDEEDAHWEYTGEAGAENWGSLDDDYATCADGTAQSPINIVSESAVYADLTNITFSYGTTALNIFNNGHTIEVAVDAGSFITYNEIQYDLLQFHFHTPSEHTVDGEAADMEVHFVHKDPLSGTLAVVGILLVADEADNTSYADIFANLPAEEGEPQPTDIVLDLNSLLPQTTLYLTYQGSLTTPPCSEIVRWLLLGSPISLSTTQIEAFAAIVPLNARPTQEQNARDVLVDTTE